MITKENASQFMPLVQGIADGKILQKRVGGSWSDISCILFNAEPSDYRIKPDLLERWIILRGDGNLYGVYLTSEHAQSALSYASKYRYDGPYTLHHMVEKL